ncbi:NB-ARC domain protein [Telmatocola sphagniphila]|uniref:NB-ARC domain protein n=1 Tax=Telmatocola sphagniphila TaxID=1123043 RepID=A0A8E6B5Y4_9BACT|nr:c-type cytochrome domain-containing protein [Telmatocola sphagniphila]QVL32069.1 NB-ARC domain protein [Telmatocola sphagniphila]
MRYLSLFLLFLSPAMGQEKKEKPLKPIEEIKLDRKDPISYEKDVEPIFADKCFVCHSGNVIESKFDMSTYAGVMKGGKRGTVIIPGKASDSFLYKVSGHREKPVMPLKGEDPLSPKELALVKAWIDQGAKAPMGMREKKKIVLNLPPESVKPVRAVAFGKKIIAVGRANQINIYDSEKFDFVKTLLDPDLKTADGKPAKAAHISLVESLAFSPDGKTLVSGSFQELNIWDIDSGKLKKKLTGFADRVTALDFSHDGKYLATGGGAPTEDGELRLYQTSDWKLIQDIKPAHSDTVYAVQFSPDNTKLASSAADKFVKVFEVPSGKLLKSFEGHTHHVLDVAWKSDGKALASAGADNVIKIWDYDKGEQIRTIQQAHTKQVTRLAFIGKTPTFMSVSGDNAFKLWNSDNGGMQRNYSGNIDYLYALAISDDGKLAAVGGEEGVVRVYKIENPQPIKVLLPPGEIKKDPPPPPTKK